MPNLQATKKALRGSKKKRQYNDRVRRQMKEATKDFTNKLEAEDVTGAEELLSTVYEKIDKANKKGIIKDNTAARKKSRFSRMLKEAK